MTNSKKVLVTGGAGYIGSHTIVELLSKGLVPIVIDDFSNSNANVFKRIEKINNKKIDVITGDIRDVNLLREIFSKYDIDSVIHFAAKKAVSESEKKPLLYYSVNVSGTLNLLNIMSEFKVNKLVFSSTATVYGDTFGKAAKETDPISPINVYGKSKFMSEELIRSLAKVNPDFSAVILRYFNPVGAHPSGLLGEDPNGKPENLMPFISQVAVGKIKKLFIFGNDYPTRDGTGARDYIHVTDLAKAHIAALEYLSKHQGVDVFNIGTGTNVTVLELLRSFQEVNHVLIPYEIVGRRVGDSAICFADVSKATKILGWKAEKGLLEMCKDTWNWQSLNPNGYISD